MQLRHGRSPLFYPHPLVHFIRVPSFLNLQPSAVHLKSCLLQRQPHQHPLSLSLSTECIHLASLSWKQMCIVLQSPTTLYLLPPPLPSSDPSRSWRNRPPVYTPNGSLLSPLTIDPHLPSSGPNSHPTLASTIRSSTCLRWDVLSTLYNRCRRFPLERMLQLDPFPRQVALDLTILLLRPHLHSPVSFPPLRHSTPTANTPLVILTKIQTGVRVRARKARQLRNGKHPRPSPLLNLLTRGRGERLRSGNADANQCGPKAWRRRRGGGGRGRTGLMVSLGLQTHAATGLATTREVQADWAISRTTGIPGTTDDIHDHRS